MTPELLVSKHGEIDERADRERNKVRFIIDLIERDEEKMRDLLLSDEERAGDELSIARKLFDRVSQTLEEIDREFVAPFGGRVAHFAPDSQHTLPPAIALGWEEYKLFSEIEGDGEPGTVYAHGIYITPDGLEIINGLRQTQGYVSAEEQRAHNRAAWEEVSAPRNS